MVGFVQFKTKDGQDVVISGTDRNGNLKSILGPPSTTIIESAIQGNVVLVFGQGDLHLTPLIASLFLESNSSGDILIGIPRNKYNQLNTRYYENFFSLIRGNGQFFYKNTLWCSARRKNDQTDEDETIFDLANIRFKPKWGIKRYKEEIEASISKELKDGSINNRAFVVTFPLNIGFEDLILDNTLLTFSNQNYQLRPIVPKLIILESINNTMYSVDPIIPIVDYLLENKIGAVIHFSWPYINGLNRFFRAANALSSEKRERLKTFHFGKRFSYELKDFVVDDILSSTREFSISSARRSHPAIEQLSLEGENWESYYPSIERISSQNILFCAPINNLFDSQAIYGTFEQLTSNDFRIRDLKEDLRDHNLPDRWLYLFKFMPFIDSFVPPNSLKYTYKFEDGTYKKLELLHAVSELKKRSNDSDIYLLNSFSAIISSLSETLNIYDYLRNLKTPNINTKYSTVVSYILKSLFEEGTTNIIACDYNARLGFKKYMADYLREVFQIIKNEMPFGYDKLLKNDFVLFPQNNILTNLEVNNREIIKFEFTENNLHHTFEIKVDVRDKGKSKVIQKKVTVTMEGIDSLYRNINYYDFKDTTLLLPGPLPIVKFDGEVPTLSESIDLFLRPIKKIIVFVNLGENYVRALEQIKSIRDFLFGNRSNRITDKDLKISYSLNNSIKLRDGFDQIFRKHKIAESFDSTNLIDNNMELQDTLDEQIREEYVENEEKVNPEEYKSLKNIWSTISLNKEYTPTTVKSDKPEEFVQVRVKYDRSGLEETISFRKGTYVRTLDEGDNEVVLAESLESGQRIAYLESDSKESLDNFFIRNYSSYSGITIEEVYEPFKCLGIFYKTLSKINFSENYSKSDFEPLYWLNESERYQLYERIRFLIEPILEATTCEEYIKEAFKNSLIWESLADVPINSLNMIKQRFALNPKISIDNLFGLALLFGLDYEIGSFRSLMNALLTGKSKYFFLDEENLLAVAHLINHALIAENYENLTAAGKNIRTVLQHVGKALKRVVSGNKRYLSDMDLLIEQKVMICTVL
ncbi:MAG: hypothetical protein ACYCT2_03940 [Thermoplasmataceae archaeon]